MPMGLQRVGHNWGTEQQHTFIYNSSSIFSLLRPEYTSLFSILHRILGDFQTTAVSKENEEGEVFMQTCWCVTINFHLPQLQGDMPVLSVFGQVTEVPPKCPGGARARPKESHQLLWRLYAPGSDYSTHRLPVRSSTPSCGHEEENQPQRGPPPLSLEKVYSSFPSTYLLFCPPPLLNSFNFAFKPQARVDHTPSKSWRRKWQPTPVFLPGESCGRGSLVGCCPWEHTESDTTEEAT